MTKPTYRNIDESEFNSLTKNARCELKNIKFSDNFIIGGRNLKNFKIENCIIDGSLTFKQTVFVEKLEFINCIITGGLIFQGTEFKSSLSFLECKIDSAIQFHNLTINKLITNDCNIKEILFKGYVNNVENEDGNLCFNIGEYEKIEFKADKIHVALDFQFAIIKELSFFYSTINKNISIKDHSQIDNIYLESSDFYGRVDFSNCSVEETAYFHKSSFYEQMLVNKESYMKYPTFANVYSKHNISIDYEDNIESLYISDCKFDISFSFTCYDDDKKQCSNSCSLNISGSFYGNIVVEGVPVSNISIGAMNFGNIIFNRVKTKLIFLQDFHNNNKLTISNIEIDKAYNLLLIYDSNINNTEFVNVDFSKFDEVVIAKSNVSNLLLSNSTFPKRIQTETKEPRMGYKIEGKINNSIYFRETYRQLKLAMEKQGNRNLALQYKAKEMYHLRKELNFGWDKLLLSMNYISNNHGVSWFRGIVFTITIAFIFFCLYDYTLPDRAFFWDMNSSFEQTRNAFSAGLDKFLSFISSFPKLRLEDNSNSWKTNLVVLLSRIFIGYGIYQTITSFRKYGK